MDLETPKLFEITHESQVLDHRLYREENNVTGDEDDKRNLAHLADKVEALTQHIVLHPFIALRRTCQVNRKCSPFMCIQPFSLIPFLYHQQREQGISALYKGLSSELLVKGMTLGIQTTLANCFDWPIEISSQRFFEDSTKVLALKGLSVAITTPFLCSSLIETVQSVIVVKDRPSFVDCLKDGFMRLFHLRLTPTSRMMPIWLLITPTVFYHIAHSALTFFSQKFISLVRGQCSNTYRPSRQHRYRNNLATTSTDGSIWQQESLTYSLKDTSAEQDSFVTENNRISDIILSSFIADVALLPLETVLHSLYVQGTRTIIDNCDQTTVVLPVLTNYDGFHDCYQSILRFEGSLGLYKGLGAIMLQYTIHYLIFRTVCYLMKEFQPSAKSNGSSNARQNRTIPNTGRVNRIPPSQRHSTPYSETFETRPFRLEGTPKRFE